MYDCLILGALFPFSVFYHRRFQSGRSYPPFACDFICIAITGLNN